MKLITLSSMFLILIALMQSCMIEEHYHFHSDMSGTYSLDFDYSMLAAEDSSGEMKESMAFFSDSLYEAVEGYQGLSNIEKQDKDYGFILSYDFESLEVLNKIESEDDPEKGDMFKKKGNKLSFRPDFSDLKDSASKGEDKDDEEIDEMMSQMFQVKTRISFDEDVKVKKMKHFKELEKNSFEYNSVEEGFSVSPILDVRLK